MLNHYPHHLENYFVFKMNNSPFSKMMPQTAGAIRRLYGECRSPDLHASYFENFRLLGKATLLMI